jgi:hypothetical protein
MTGGYVIGGWGYVWTAYGITATVFIIYGISLWLRAAAQSREGRGPSPGQYQMDDTVRVAPRGTRK